MVSYTDNPSTSDDIYFDLQTVDSDDNPANPYKIDKITIYYIERGFSVENIYSYEQEIEGKINKNYFKDAVVIKTFGDDTTPAWLSTDTSSAFIEQLTEDEDGNSLFGEFRLVWDAQNRLAREGDYVLCYKWTPIIAGDTLTSNIYFYIYSDVKQNTSLPSHATAIGKYETLLERYTPEMFSMFLSQLDLTPDIIDRLNGAIAKGFVGIEDLANQMLDLSDANAVSEALLSYMGNLFGTKLYGQDVTLWRKQIKRSVPLYKKKGTLSGLTEALANSDISLKSITKLWQVVSLATWQESFIFSDTYSWVLEKLAILPVDSNFELYLNDELVSITNVSFSNSGGETIMTWLSSLDEDDAVRIVYKFAEPADQDIEDYIRTLPLADNREDVDFPKKNWNVRLIAEDDSLFDIIIPEKHPFYNPVIFGKIRTEFPYGENIYNMEAYNGTMRDSTDPCHIDKDFLDFCSYCQSSKFNIDLEIEDLSAERLTEAEEIVKNFVPFHAIVNTMSYTASKTEFIPSPQEEIEILIRQVIGDNIVLTNPSFNRIIEEGDSYDLELNRSMLADVSYSNHTGTGTNSAVAIFSQGIHFNKIGISDNNVLEILSGANSGNYTVTNPSKNMVDIVESGLIGFPLNTSGFPFRLSNVIYSDVVSIYQINDIRFSSDISFVSYGVSVGWKVIITSGIYAGTYLITSVNTDDSLNLSGLTGNINTTEIAFELRTDLNALRYTGSSGVIATQQLGEVQCASFVNSISPGDFVVYSGQQYEVLTVENTTNPNLYIENYTSGDVVGTASIDVYRRIIDSSVGYLSFRGMELTGTIPVIDETIENNQFLENYMILIGDNYYKISEIDVNTMILSGKILNWGISGTSVSYSIAQFIKLPVVTQDGVVYFQLDRRGNDCIVVEQGSSSMNMSSDVFSDKISQSENIRIDIKYR